MLRTPSKEALYAIIHLLPLDIVVKEKTSISASMLKGSNKRFWISHGHYLIINQCYVEEISSNYF